MKQLVLGGVPALLLFAVVGGADARAPLIPRRACPCEEGIIHEPQAIWYGWGGTIGRMLPVPPPPPPWGPDACGVIGLDFPMMPPSPKPPSSDKGPAVPPR